MTTSVQNAIFRLVHDHPGGAAALAQVVGKRADTLSHEVSPVYPTAKIGLLDAVKLSLFTGDRQVLNAWAGDMGCMLLPLAADVPGVEGIGARTASLAKEFAELMGTVARDLSDGDVSANDLARIDREASELVSAIQALLGTVRTMHATAVQDSAGSLRAVA